MEVFVKQNKGDSVWWLVDPEIRGEFIFSFDKNKTFNLFRDYPWKLTKKQKQIFDRENPFWVDFFKDRNDNESQS